MSRQCSSVRSRSDFPGGGSLQFRSRRPAEVRFLRAVLPLSTNRYNEGVIRRRLFAAASAIWPLIFVASVLVPLVGCANDAHPMEFNWDDPKITAMRPAV